MPIDIATTNRPSANADRATSIFSSANKLTPRERMFFTERLALMLETGNSLHGSLEDMAQQSNSPGLSHVLRSLQQSITEGATFSASLRQHSSSFSVTYINLVRAAEQGGFLQDVLEQLAKLERNASEIRNSVASAFSYPAFLLAFSFGVVAFVLAAVFPKFAALFLSIYDQLPLSTKALMAISHILTTHWPWVLASTGVTCCVLWGWWRSSGAKAFVDRIKLRMPIVRELIIELYMVQSLRVMALSLGHGVSIIDALRATRDIVNNLEYRRGIDTVIDEVEQGRGLAAGFEKSAILPPLAQQMIRTGEETSRLALVLDRVATFYETELSRRLALFSKLVEPAMLLVMGSIVGLIVASLILPIFKLSKAVQ